MITISSVSPSGVGPRRLDHDPRPAQSVEALAVLVRGRDWTDGCIAVSNADIVEIWSADAETTRRSTPAPERKHVETASSFPNSRRARRPRSPRESLASGDRQAPHSSHGASTISSQVRACRAPQRRGPPTPRKIFDRYRDFDSQSRHAWGISWQIHHAPPRPSSMARLSAGIKDSSLPCCAPCVSSRTRFSPAIASISTIPPRSPTRVSHPAHARLLDFKAADLIVAGRPFHRPQKTPRNAEYKTRRRSATNACAA